ncbi:hypothetical protein [Chitinophaga sp.]|uniref:hypothetical protein n=1 Tax=Chitinophaga sp. TaxID=1869181 RepID=UPI0031D33958
MIGNLELLYAVFPDWKANEISLIKSLNWSGDVLTMVGLCRERGKEISLPDLSGCFYEVSINFQGVSNLQLNFKGDGLHQVTGFNIIDVSGNNWEHINFQIEDY